MAKRIVVALGGNAILTSDPTAQAQSMALNKTAPVFACVLPSCQVPVFSPASFGEAFYPRIFCRIEISDCSPQKDTY